jgi:hypothetical protein
MPIDVQTIYSPQYGYPTGGMVMAAPPQAGPSAPGGARVQVEELPPPPPQGAAPLPAPARPEAAPGSQIVVNAAGRDIAAARQAGQDEAMRQLALKGLPGPLRLMAESFNDGAYTALYQYGPAAPDTAAPQARQKPSWILVLPVEVGKDGKVRWERGTDWAKAWLVPARRDGVRLVSTVGDADDHDRFPLSAMSDPSSQEAEAAAASLSKKYGAPAVALVRWNTADQGLKVTLWSADGTSASRDTEAADAAGARAATLDLVLHLAADAPPPAAPAEAGIPAEVRLRHLGGDAYKVYVHVETDRRADIVEKLDAVRDLSVAAVQSDASGYGIEGEWVGEGEGAFRSALRDAGFAPK